MKFYIVDVFAKAKYQGNQLAVFIEDREQPKELMQQIARETNFSETTFVLPRKRDDGGYQVRVFTPEEEIPFAGHPTLGTAYIIHKIIEKGKTEKVHLNMEVGQIPVSIDNGTFIMEQNQPSFEKILEDRGMMAKVLNIEEKDIDADYPIQVVSTGLPCVVVPLRSSKAISRAKISHEHFRWFIENVIKCNLLVFSSGEKNKIKSRVFMDERGFPEDPATGSANGNLAGYLLKYNYFKDSKLNYTALQGEEIGRPSYININASISGERFVIKVGGQVHMVAEGEWL